MVVGGGEEKGQGEGGVRAGEGAPGDWYRAGGSGRGGCS